jgi:hypothetical protein
METARDKAINQLLDLVIDLAKGGGLPTREDVAPVVDAIIDAARAPESEHTRAMQRELDVRGTAGGKATTETTR